MEEHEVIFKQRFPSRDFIKYEMFDGSKADEIYGKLLTSFGVEKDIDRVSIIKKIISQSTMEENPIEESEFNLLNHISDKNFVSEYIYINYKDFSCIHLIKSKDLNRYFDDIYFPSSDDIELFDFYMRWFIHINHEREIFISYSGNNL